MQTVETRKFTTLLQMLTSVNHPIFVTGGTGTGKSMIVQKFIQDQRQNERVSIMPIVMNFSAQTSAASTLQDIDSKITKKGGKVYGAQGNAQTLIFIDDVNMPQVE